jgi:hypothetical protein
VADIIARTIYQNRDINKGKPLANLAASTTVIGVTARHELAQGTSPGPDAVGTASLVWRINSRGR